MTTLAELMQSGDRNAINAFLSSQTIGGGAGGMTLNGQPSPELNQFLRPQETQDVPQQMPQRMQLSQLMQPMNTIRTDTGEYLNPQGNRQANPFQFQSQAQTRPQGSPVDVFGQGKGYMQPDGTIIGTNAQGRQFKVQPRGTEEAGRRRQIQDMKFNTEQQNYRAGELDIQAKQMLINKGGLVDAPPPKSSPGSRVFRDSQGDWQSELIPGSPQHQAMKDKYSKDTAMVKNASDEAGILMDKVDKLSKHPGLPRIFGVTGVFPNYPGGDAADAGVLLDELKNTMQLAGFQNLRNSGSSPGVMTEREWPKMEAAIALLAKATSVKQAKDSMNNIRAFATRIRETANKAYQDEWSGSQFSQKAAGDTQSNDAAALDWANANPRDPRSAQIKQKLGVR